jgi:hypothetical protein
MVHFLGAVFRFERFSFAVGPDGLALDPACVAW